MTTSMCGQALIYLPSLWPFSMPEVAPLDCRLCCLTGTNFPNTAVASDKRLAVKKQAMMFWDEDMFYNPWQSVPPADTIGRWLDQGNGHAADWHAAAQE